MGQSVIFHVDVNAAYLSWEAVHRLQDLGEVLDLRTVPAAIGGDIEKRKGVILAKSTPCKVFDVQTGEPTVKALSKCPNLILAKPNYKLYQKYSKAFMTILGDYTPLVEQYSIDEAYMDMTGTEALFGEPIALAHTIKDRIFKELGFTVNIGISHTKILAKMASDLKKPNLVHTLFPSEIQTKLWPLPVRTLFFVGRASEQKLKRLGIHTIGQLAQMDPAILKLHLNKQGLLIHQYANGIDHHQMFHTKVSNKGYGNGTTTPFNVESSEVAKHVILSLCETLGTRLRADNARTPCVSVSIVDVFFEQHTHQKMLPTTTNSTSELYQYACLVFDELWKETIPIRQIRVQANQVTYEGAYQYNLFDTPNHEKYEKLDQAIDAIRQKFGNDAIKRSSFIKGPMDQSSLPVKKQKNGLIE